MKRRRDKLACWFLLCLSFGVLALTVGFYGSARDLLAKAEAVQAEAEESYINAQILHNRAQEALAAAETMEPEQVIVVEEKVIYVERLPERTAEAPEEAPAPVPQQVSMGTYTITAYCPCEICCGYYARTRPLDENGKPIVYTASGALAQAGTTIAVDTSVIPHGTSVWFEGPDGMHEYIAQDTGSAVTGCHIDLYFDSHAEAVAWGAQTREVFKEVGV